MSKFEATVGVVEPPDGHFAALAALQAVFHFWWFVFLLAAAGGFAGWLANRTEPPVYEAVAHFSTSIDYIRTGPMTQFEEDTAFETVGNVIISVTQSVVDQAAAEGIQTSAAELGKATVLERRVNVWDLRVRNTSAHAAERLANLWAEQGHAALLEGYRHTLLADQWERYAQSLESCLAKTVASEPASGQCSKARLAEVQNDIQEAGQMLYQERLASLGLFSGLTIGPAEQAVTPSSPVLFRRNQMVLAGCLIGLLLGIALVEMGIPARLLARKPGIERGVMRGETRGRG